MRISSLCSLATVTLISLLCYVRTTCAYAATFQRLGNLRPLRPAALGKSWFLRGAAGTNDDLIVPQSKGDYESGGPQRLYPDIDDLTSWLTSNGGFLRAAVHSGHEGWLLLSEGNVTAGSTIASIPKKLCLYADPKLMGVPFLDATARVMESLLPSQWRARLAVALLSERVRPESFFSPYIRNLPFEFQGMPIFYSPAEQKQLQDEDVIEGARTRSRFLADFTATVLSPLRRTALDPFSGHAADADALAWGFAAASSRALRSVLHSSTHQQDIQRHSATVIDTTGVAEEVVAAAAHSTPDDLNGRPPSYGPAATAAKAVLVPGIDFAAHSFTPNCAVRDAGDKYVLYATQAVQQGQQLTVDYGALSNGELLLDYGFTVDTNPHDRFTLRIDPLALQDAREVGRQLSPQADLCSNQPLQSWQKVWFACAGVPADPAVNFNAVIAQAPRAGSMSTPLVQVDARLLALLRVLHSTREADLLGLGCDPFLLQRPGGALGAARESKVVLTLISLLLIALRNSGSELGADLCLLRNSAHRSAPEVAALSRDGEDFLSTSSGGGGGLPRAGKGRMDISCDQILRSILAGSRARHPSDRSAAALLSKASESTWDLLPAADSNGVSSFATKRDISSGATQCDTSLEVKAILSSPRNSVTHFHLRPSAGSDEAGGGAETEVVDLSALQTMGAALAPNTREAYRYRIRRKRAIAELVLQLTELYGLLGGAGASGSTGGVVGPRTENFGPGAEGPAQPRSRIDKIRQLLDEGKLRGASDEGLVNARTFAAKWPQSL